VEANPESLDQDHLFCMQESGVTRISLGVQDMSDAVLMASGRLSSKRDDILKSLDLLGSSWKGQKSADFICGLPGQSPEAFCRGLLRALDAGLDHVSLYDLTLEESSPLLNAMNSGHVPALDEDCLAELKSSARELLSDHGFTRYEVSNYSRSGGESVHNRHYWSMDAWIASGPGSSGSIPLADGTTERTICLADLDSFCLDPLSATRIELIDRRTASFEYIMMGIRTIWGIDRKGFMDRFQIGIETVIGASLKSWNGRIIKTEGAYVPNQDALDHLNAFLRECLSEMDRTWPA
jgi:oxygen-independent coproporphyrinogen-3 oxidase